MLFSLDHKLYASDYDYDSVATENQLAVTTPAYDSDSDSVANENRP